MPTVAEHLTALVQAAAEAAGHAEAPVPLDPCVATRDPSHGDYQSNFAFRLGKALRTNPRAVAEQIKAALPPDPAVARAEVAGPGFLNFFLDEQWLAGRLKQGIQGPERSGRTMVLDYSSPNIAKRMHVGHLRSTIIGAALHRLYSWLGWTVIADNHLGDWGTPIGKLIVAWKRWRDPAAYEADPIGELQRLYEQASAASKDDPEFLQAARAETVLLQQGDAANMSLWTEFMRATRVELDQIYGRLDISFDAWLGESAYRDRLDALVGELLAAGIAVESEGAVIVPLEGNLSDHPLLVRKADGGMLYGTTDLATIRHRIETWDPERIVYVTDTRQQLHFQQVFAAAKKIGMTGPDYVHVWFGMLKDPTGQVAAAREGGAVNLVEVLDTAAAKAFEVVTEKSPDLPEEERRQIAEAVGVGTIKYFDLSQNPQSDITFSWEKALSLDGGSAVYLMYAYARLHSILRGGGAAGVPPDVLPAVEHPAERALAALAVRTPEAVATAAEAYRPNLLAEHLDALAKAVGPFYEHCPVLKEGVDPDVRARRLALVHGVAQALEVGLSLLGIRAIPRM